MAQRAPALATLVLLAAATALAPGEATAQDAAAGQRVFNQCRACHTIEQGGRNGVGPNLHGVIGRKAASIEGFRYSNAMQQKGQQGWTWTEENLHPYLRNPREVVPGTNMAFAGLRNEQQLNDVIAYLKQQSQ
jgi:cytochrome c